MSFWETVLATGFGAGLGGLFAAATTYLITKRDRDQDRRLFLQEIERRRDDYERLVNSLGPVASAAREQISAKRARQITIISLERVCEQLGVTPDGVRKAWPGFLKELAEELEIELAKSLGEDWPLDIEETMKTFHDRDRDREREPGSSLGTDSGTEDRV